eukprot:TRINITY_DN2818_c0_g1_i1.p1 TRINITY_DN2818_c0_g1~~TRINITY_DN2818_c0_g1_i1.p1  ORF type:complete len:142 (+),score=28.24 TRINITY_DN2818_c0_g1_i1:136-561(+)
MTLLMESLLTLQQIDPSNPHGAAHALKNFLKKATPLIHRDAQPKLLTATTSQKHEQERITDARFLLSQMAQANVSCLDMLFNILHKVEKFKEYNQMHSQNLGIVFAPVLFPDLPFDTLMMSGPLAVGFLLENHPFIFGSHV